MIKTGEASSVFIMVMEYKMSQLQDDYNELYRKGIAAFKAKNAEQARSYFLSASVLDPQQKTAWLALAKIENNADKRTEYYRKVAQIDPKDPIARAYLDGLSSVKNTPKPRRVGIPLWLGVLGFVLLLTVFGVGFVLNQNQSANILPTQMMMETASQFAQVLEQSEATPIASETIALTEIVLETSTETTLVPTETVFVMQEVPVLNTVQFNITLEPQITSTQSTGSLVIPPTNTVQFVPPTATLPTVPIPTLIVPTSGVTFVVTTSTPNPNANATTTPVLNVTQPPTALIGTVTSMPLLVTATFDFQEAPIPATNPADPPSTVEPNSGGRARR
jgi:hypothetical protein